MSLSNSRCLELYSSRELQLYYSWIEVVFAVHEIALYSRYDVDMYVVAAYKFVVVINISERVS